MAPPANAAIAAATDEPAAHRLDAEVAAWPTGCGNHYEGDGCLDEPE